MGKKQPSRRQWRVQLEALYRRDRDERIVRAYELALPVIISKPTPRTQEEEETNHEALTPYGHLRSRL